MPLNEDEIYNFAYHLAMRYDLPYEVSNGITLYLFDLEDQI